MTNKEMARDPVGATIKRDLLAKKGYDMISNVRSGQYLRIHISAKDEEEAKEILDSIFSHLDPYEPFERIQKAVEVLGKQDNRFQ